MKALAHYYKAKFLLLDVMDFSIKVITSRYIFLSNHASGCDITFCLATDSEQIWPQLQKQRCGKVSYKVF